MRDLRESLQVREHRLGLILNLLRDRVESLRRGRRHGRVVARIRDLNLVVVLDLLDDRS